MAMGVQTERLLWRAIPRKLPQSVYIMLPALFVGTMARLIQVWRKRRLVRAAIAEEQVR